MNKKQILNHIATLAQSQGAYERLLKELNENEELLEYFEKQNFNDVVDLIMFIEG